MKKTDFPQQLDLPFEVVTLHEAGEPTNNVLLPQSQADVPQTIENKSGKIIDFNSAFLKQKGINESVLYRLILDSLRHLK